VPVPDPPGTDPPGTDPPGTHPPGTDPPGTDAAARLHRALLARGETVAAAESLTAGLFCATLAGVPGASATLRGGAVVYATDLKATLVGVPQPVLDAHGAVSPQTAAALAEGVRERCTATWGVGLTGVAGPDPADGYGPGTVYLGIAGPGRTDVVRLDLPGDRQAVRTGAVAAAVTALLDTLTGDDGTGRSPGKVDAGSGVTP
jgi:nicotinamide-nucleotide amidase